MVGINEGDDAGPRFASPQSPRKSGRIPVRSCEIHRRSLPSPELTSQLQPFPFQFPQLQFHLRAERTQIHLRKYIETNWRRGNFLQILKFLFLLVCYLMIWKCSAGFEDFIVDFDVQNSSDPARNLTLHE